MSSYSLQKFLKSPMPLSSLPYVLLGLGAIGFLDALYLTIEHYRSVIPPCTLKGCDVVLTSPYATVFGIPLALIGAIFYAVIMLLSIILITSYSSSQQSESRSNSLGYSRTLHSMLFVLCLLGFLVGLYLIYLQAFVIHAFCQYCLLSEVIDFLLFDTAWWLYNGLR